MFIVLLSDGWYWCSPASAQEGQWEYSTKGAHDLLRMMKGLSVLDVA